MPKIEFRKKLLDATSSHVAVTFNDVILLPSWTAIEPDEADVTTIIAPGRKPDIKIPVPFISSPMDTVTESEMAIALAREGGLGIIHRNCSIEEQVAMVKKVKRSEANIIRDVYTISADEKIWTALEIMREKDVHGLPVITQDNKLIGIVTGRDVRFADVNLKVRDVMTKDVITASKDITPEEAKKTLHKHRIEKLPVVDKEGFLYGLITTKDLMLKGKFPNASRDYDGRLFVGAAISPFDFERARVLSKFCDLLVTDVSHFHNKNCFEETKKMLKEISVPIIVGNIGTYEAAVDCITKLDGIAGLRVGIGSGSICSTSVVTRAGSPTLYATLMSADAKQEYGAQISIIADGGITNPGDIAVALSAGASAVMMGNIFAGCKESPGQLIGIGGLFYKKYYGMGSQAAREKRFALDRYSKPSKNIDEGVEGFVAFRGPVHDTVYKFVGGLKAAMGYIGAENIEEMWVKGKFASVSAAGIKETHPHDIFLPGKESPKR
ncbi:MAG: IMP dehydrogenase [Candidatus Helarchaeota archaeon]